MNLINMTIRCEIQALGVSNVLDVMGRKTANNVDAIIAKNNKHNCYFEQINFFHF